MMLVVLVTSYGVFAFSEIAVQDKYPDYTNNVAPYLMGCKLDELPTRGGDITRSPIKWYSICASFQIFGNENVIPAMFSLMVIPLTFQLGAQLSSSKLVGLIAAMLLVASPMFHRWDTTATYDQSWTFFLLLSMVLLTRTKPVQSSIFYLASILSKGLSLLYAPMMLYHQYKTDKSRMIPICVILGISTAAIMLTGFGGDIEFDHEEFVKGLWIWYFYFADPLIMIFPVVLLLLFTLRKKIPNSDVMIVWIVGIILTTPLILGLTNQLVHPYRFVPFMALYSICIGMIVDFYINNSRRRPNQKWLSKNV